MDTHKRQNPIAQPAEDRARAGRAGNRRLRPQCLPLIGAQISTAGGFAPVPERAIALGAEVVQIFSSNPRMWKTREIEPEEMSALMSGLQRYHLPLYFHTIYLINLASPDEALRTRSKNSLAHALFVGAVAGAAGVVTHIGSHRGRGFTTVADPVVQAIKEATETACEWLTLQEHLPESTVLEHRRQLPRLLLETGVDAGGIVGGRLDELAVLLTSFETEAPDVTPGIGICLDTAHLFAAGYPIHRAAGLGKVIDELSRLKLLSKIGLIHLNDSGSPFASNRDRHANPGDGHIGYRGLARIVRHPALAHIPFVLEVPGAAGHGPEASNVALVKTMREAAPSPPTLPVPGASHPAG